MTIAQRIMRCRLIEEAERDPEYAAELGLQDQTEYRGFYLQVNKDSSDFKEGGGQDNEESRIQL